MKNFLFLWALIIGFGCVACSDNDDKTEGEEPEVLTLSVTPEAILANGVDKANFKVVNGRGDDVTAACSFTVNGAAHKEAFLVSETPKVYKVVAVNAEGVKSNEVTVSAIDENTELTVKTDKQTIVADGGDLCCLSLIDENGMDVAGEAVFYCNDEKIETGRVFKTTKTGSCIITAEWKGISSTESALISAKATESQFTGRMLVESSTSTNCKFCPAVIKILKVYKTEPRIVLVNIHRENSTIYTRDYTGNTKKVVDEFVKYYEPTQGPFDYPKVFLNRAGKATDLEAIGEAGLKNNIPARSEVGIAMQTSVDEENGVISVSAAIRSTQAFEGKVGIIITEAGLMAHQMNGETGETEKDCVMRNYSPSFAGVSKTFAANQVTSFSGEIALEKAKPENCDVIVFVCGQDGKIAGVQHVKAGKAVGY